MIEVSHLTKRYGAHAAVSDISFTIEKGHVYGFLGPNGAGKSTTMNILTGCLAPTEGQVTIGGHDILEEPRQAKRLVGYLPELPPLYGEQTPREYLYFVARAKGLTKAQALQEIDRTMTLTHIENVADKLIRHLSKGYRQRVGIAQALLGSPEIVILDEPTVGLDPAQIQEIRDLIRSFSAEHTVILSSHILSEIQAVCDRVIIINKGRLIADDAVENLGKSLNTGNRVELCVDATEEELRGALAGLEQLEELTVTERSEDGLTALLSVGEAEPKEISREIARRVSAAGLVLLQLNPVKRQLEEVFLELTEGNEPAAAPAAETVTEESAAAPAAEAEAEEAAEEEAAEEEAAEEEAAEEEAAEEAAAPLENPEEKEEDHESNP